MTQQLLVIIFCIIPPLVIGLTWALCLAASVADDAIETELIKKSFYDDLGAFDDDN